MWLNYLALTLEIVFFVVGNTVLYSLHVLLNWRFIKLLQDLLLLIDSIQFSQKKPQTLRMNVYHRISLGFRLHFHVILQCGKLDLFSNHLKEKIRTQQRDLQLKWNSNGDVTFLPYSFNRAAHSNRHLCNWNNRRLKLIQTLYPVLKIKPFFFFKKETKKLKIKWDLENLRQILCRIYFIHCLVDLRLIVRYRYTLW